MRKKIIIILFCWLGLLAAAQDYLQAPVLDIAVSGNLIYSKEDILERSAVRTRTGQRIDYAVLQDDLSRIMALGGFQAVEVDLQPYRNGLQIIFIVRENPVIQAVEFSGNRSLSKRQLGWFWQNAANEQLNYLALDTDIRRLNQAYLREGYDLSAVQRVDLTADNILKVQIREPEVEEVLISGNLYTSPELIRREMSLQPGSVYNSNAFYADRTRIFRLGYFSSVSMPEIVENGDSVDLYLQVREKKKSLLNVGLGVTSRERFAFSRLNLINLFRTGEQIQINVQFGQEYRKEGALPKFSYRLRYYYPWFFLRDMSWGVSKYLGIGYENLRNLQDGTSELLSIRRDGFSSDLSMPLPFNPRYNLLLEYRDEFVQEDVLLSPDVHYLKRSLSAVFTYNGQSYLNETPVVLDGDLWQVRLEKGGRADFFGGTLFDFGGVNFHRAEFQYSRFMSLTEDNHIIGLNYRNGAYDSSQDATILEGEEYSMGGGDTVRGYADPEPFAVGPKMILLNAEYRYIFNNVWQGVLFYDWGNAFSSPEISVKEFKSGYGAGVRIATPVGPLRFDLGRGEQYWIFHFGLGYTF